MRFQLPCLGGHRTAHDCGPLCSDHWLLLNRFRIAALPPLWSPVRRASVAAPIGPKISLGPDEWSRISNGTQDAPIERLGGNRFGEKFRNTGVASGHDVLHFRM